MIESHIYNAVSDEKVSWSSTSELRFLTLCNVVTAEAVKKYTQSHAVTMAQAKCILENSKPTVLQQKFVNQNGDVKWVNVPTVIEESAAPEITLN